MDSLLQQLKDWTTTTGSVPIPTVGPSTLTLTVLLALLFGIPWKLGLKNSEPFKKHFCFNKYVFWAHGILTFTVLWVCEPRNLGSLLEYASIGLDSSLARWFQQALLSLLAVVLWDFGYVHSGISQVLLNCHHIGAFLPVVLGQGWDIDAYLASDDTTRLLLDQQTSLDARMFGWLWMIHSFGFLLEVVLPLVGIRLQEGSRSHSVDALKHAYSVVSVYFFHQYLNFTPDRFFTYQTSTLLIMLTGRYFINNNWKAVDFLRRVEFPGFWIVLLDRVLGFHDPFCHRSLALVVELAAAYVVYAVFFKAVPPMPETYVGPDQNPALKKFLERETPVVRGDSKPQEDLDKALDKFRTSRGIFVNWWEGQKWGDKYPIHDRIMVCQPGDLDDVKLLAKLLQASDDVDVDAPLDVLKDLTALTLAAFNKYAYECTLLLLQKGANPYKPDSKGGCAFLNGTKDTMNLSLLPPGSLGHSEGFWNRFNAICLKQSPAKVLTRKDKFWNIVRSF